MSFNEGIERLTHAVYAVGGVACLLLFLIFLCLVHMAFIKDVAGRPRRSRW